MPVGTFNFSMDNWFRVGQTITTTFVKTIAKFSWQLWSLPAATELKLQAGRGYIRQEGILALSGTVEQEAWLQQQLDIFNSFSDSRPSTACTCPLASWLLVVCCSPTYRQRRRWREPLEKSDADVHIRPSHSSTTTTLAWTFEQSKWNIFSLLFRRLFLF